jgi:hypothetical protein
VLSITVSCSVEQDPDDDHSEDARQQPQSNCASYVQPGLAKPPSRPGEEQNKARDDADRRKPIHFVEAMRASSGGLRSFTESTEGSLGADLTEGADAGKEFGDTFAGYHIVAVGPPIHSGKDVTVVLAHGSQPMEEFRALLNKLKHS